MRINSDVLAVCLEDFLKVIDKGHFIFYNAADEVVIYGNPCTMQIILEHWTDVKLKSSAKKVNAPLIQQFTGVENYKGRASKGFSYSGK